MTRDQAFKLAGDLADAGFSCHQTFQKRSGYTTVVIDEKRVDRKGLALLSADVQDYAELVLIDGVLQFLPTRKEV